MFNIWEKCHLKFLLWSYNPSFIRTGRNLWLLETRTDTHTHIHMHRQGLSRTKIFSHTEMTEYKKIDNPNLMTSWRLFSKFYIRHSHGRKFVPIIFKIKYKVQSCLSVRKAKWMFRAPLPKTTKNGRWVGNTFFF